MNTSTPPLGCTLGDKWASPLTDYLTAMRAAGRARATVTLHQHYVTRVALANPAGPWVVTTRDLQRFLSPAQWAPETRKSARAVCRGFYSWAHGSGHVEHNPAAALAPVRVPPARPRPTPEHLVRQLVHHDDPRLGFMAMLAAYAGLRCAEIARVHGGDLVDDTLLVHGKGGKVRGVPVIYPPLLARLQALGGWAFPGTGVTGHLAPHTVSKMMSAAMPPGWTAHTLRHRMATQAYAGTRDLLAVGAVLGHTRPETTQRYVLLPDDAIRGAVRAAAG